MNLVVAAVSVLPNFNVMSVAGGVNPTVNSMLAAFFVNPSVDLVSTSFNVNIVEDLVTLVVFDPASDGLGLTSDLRNFRDGGLRGRAFLTFRKFRDG